MEGAAGRALNLSPVHNIDARPCVASRASRCVVASICERAALDATQRNARIDSSSILALRPTNQIAEIST